MDAEQQKQLAESDKLWEQAIALAKEKGMRQAKQFLRKHGLDSPDAEAVIGMALGTWEPVEYDEEGKIRLIRN